MRKSHGTLAPVAPRVFMQRLQSNCALRKSAIVLIEKEECFFGIVAMTCDLN